MLQEESDTINKEEIYEHSFIHDKITSQNTLSNKLKVYTHKLKP